MRRRGRTETETENENEIKNENEEDFGRVYAASTDESAPRFRCVKAGAGNAATARSLLRAGKAGTEALKVPTSKWQSWAEEGRGA